MARAKFGIMLGAHGAFCGALAWSQHIELIYMNIRMLNRVLAFIAITAAFGLALTLRNAWEPFVFQSGDVVFPGFDPQYHMRRVFQTLADYPHVPIFDPYINYPVGSVTPWTPFFDYFVATVNAAFGYGAEDVTAVETLSAYMVPVIGAFTVVPAYFFAKETLGFPAAVISAFILAVIPVHIMYSRAGFVDHHTAVTFIQLVMFHAFLKAADSISTRERAFWTLASAVWLALGFLTWNGYIFLAAILDICLVILLLKDGLKRGGFTPHLLWITHFAAGLAVLPFSLDTIAAGGPPFTYLSLSLFHPLVLFGAGSIGLLALASGALMGGYPEARRRGVFIAGLALLFMAALVVINEVVSGGLGWLFASDRFMSTVRESQPLMFHFSLVSWLLP